MGTSEHDIQNEIRLAIGETNGAVLFRANVGKAWAGDLWQRYDNAVTLKNARRFTTGLPNGFPDLFGFKPVTITPDMVGEKVAVFAFVEVKTATGRVSKAQQHMHKFLLDAGALGGIARSPDEALELLGLVK